MTNSMNIAKLSLEVTSEANAYAYFERLRWNGTPKCAHCDATNVYFIEPKNGVSRATRTGSQSQRRVWRCKDCKKQFSVITNTVMHGTKIPVRVWLMVIFELCSSKNGVAAREVERKYGIAGRSAWFMLHRIREAMAHDDFVLFSGDVVSDEAYIGGDPEYKHADKRHGLVIGERKSAGTEKTPVVTLIDVDTHVARSQTLEWVDSKSLGDVLRANVDMATTVLHTDSLTAYVPVGRKMAGHYRVDHKSGIYATDKTTGTNMCENYFAQLKRGLKGTHIHVDPKHLHRYLGEFDYRYSTCELNDEQRMADLATRVAGRLTYKVVTAA
jgi:transposase-like protein